MKEKYIKELAQLRNTRESLFNEKIHHLKVKERYEDVEVSLYLDSQDPIRSYITAALYVENDIIKRIDYDISKVDERIKELEVMEYASSR